MPRQAMPRKLVFVVLLLSLGLALDLYNVCGEIGGPSGYVRIALNIALLVGLLRGQEWARVLAKVTAVLSLVAGGFLLVQMLALGGIGLVDPVLTIAIYVTVGLSLVYGTFLLWCMNKEDVQAWLSQQVRR